MNWLYVMLGAMAGAPLRYLTDRAVQSRHDSVFPWGTFTVNVTGSLVLGLLTGAAAAGAADSRLQLLLGTGL
ncbi:CrcB family protein, partial [Streptomyces sp. SM1]